MDVFVFSCVLSQAFTGPPFAFMMASRTAGILLATFRMASEPILYRAKLFGTQVAPRAGSALCEGEGCPRKASRAGGKASRQTSGQAGARVDLIDGDALARAAVLVGPRLVGNFVQE